MKNGALVVLFVFLYNSLQGFTQTIINKSNEPVSGKVIYKRESCKHDIFNIREGSQKDVNSGLCLVKEITVGSGPDENFVRNIHGLGWSNILELSKSGSGSWSVLLNGSKIK